MYTLIKLLSVRELLTRQAPAIVVSLAIAELFYKFHSFVLESVTFLATWGVIDWLWQRLSAPLDKNVAPRRSDQG